MLDKKLGYYTCNGKEFDSKIKASLYSLEVRKKMSWHFNDEVFSNFDWTVEPSETLDQLYDQRTRSLREKYDYIMLSYSGGADSHNILMSFIRQGLFIDEIVVNTMEKGTRKFTDINAANKENKNAAAEYQLQTFPRLKEVENLIPNTKITILDLSDHLFDFLNTVGDGSWVLDKREQVNIAGATRFNYIHFDNIRKEFDKDKKIALILGIEKPRTYIKDGIFYMCFQDRAANIVTVAEHMRDYTNSSVEFFYWSPEATKLICKQVHVIKKWLEAFPEKQKLWELDGLFNPTTYRMIHERILRTLIYTTWNDDWYQADKAVKDWYSEFDAWFYEGFSDTKAFHVWKDGLSYLEQSLGGYIKKDENGQSDGLYSFFQYHKIGSMKVLRNRHD
jgi:hypothetical protein